ncbi:MAG: cell wall metabolism sensor histidine kinase WalK [candidate division WOR-3 bacterium]|nr:cell wall metabolism sensor histidine kinase WalK [candidate division WOR-3 bacterium]
MRLNLFLRQFLTYALIIILTTSIIILITSYEYKKNYLKSLEIDLQKQAEIIRAEIKDDLINKKYKKIDSFINNLAPQIKTRITIIRNDGVVIAESDYSADKMEDHSTRSEFIQAIQTGLGKKIRFSKTMQQNMLYVAVPITDNNKVLAVVRTSAYLSPIQKDLSAVNRKIIYFAAILTILALILAFIFSKNVIQPIRLLTKTAERIKNGEFQTHIISNRQDEIGDLTKAINKMADSLNTLFNTLHSEREEIKSVLSAMTEGLLVLNDKDQIIATNESFKTIANVNNVIGQYYWQIIKHNLFNQLVAELRDKKILRNQEIELNNNIYAVSGKLIEGQNGRNKAIFVFYDITEVKKLEKIKADFIANVSHELKTPLTSIKGFADTLTDEVSKKHQKFVRTISRNADRLINIVQDLLVISDLENREQKLEVEKINFPEMLSNLKKMFSANLKSKKLKLNLKIESDAQEWFADYFLIEQMFTNLIDNAIKYNREKGEIYIIIQKVDDNLKIIVEDTGIGISREHWDRIFERFYVVDKSRSRKLGGTGLGLAIVKHIVLSHNGEIKVESEVGKGTRFIVTLPQYSSA